MTDLKARLDALSEAATPGPWYVTELPWFDSADGIVAGSPDGNICAPVADFEQYGAGYEYHYQGSTFSMGDIYDARADTQFVVDVVNAYRSGDLVTKDQLEQAVREEREACAHKAREYAANYPEASDGRNTFIILAEQFESNNIGRSLAAVRARTEGESQ